MDNLAWQNLKAALDQSENVKNRNSAKIRLIDDIVEYTNEPATRKLVYELVNVITNVDSRLGTRQQAAAALNDITLTYATSNGHLPGDEWNHDRYRTAMAIQELARDLSNRVMVEESAIHGHSLLRDPGNEISLIDVINLQLERSKLVHLGDTGHHENSRTQKWLGNADVIQSLYESGVRDIFVERGTKHQDIADDFAFGRISRADFVERMIREDAINGARQDTLNELGELAELIGNATEAGVRVHFADQWTASAYSKDMRENLKTLGNGELPEDVRQRAGRAVIDAYVSDAGEAIREFAEHRVMQQLDPETNVHDRALERFVFEKRYRDLRVRHDARLASYVADALETSGGKGVLFYGSAHGRHDGDADLDEQVRRLGITLSRIDVFINDAAFEQSFQGYFDPEKPDLPESIYVFGPDEGSELGILRSLDRRGPAKNPNGAVDKMERRDPASDLPVGSLIYPKPGGETGGGMPP